MSAASGVLVQRRSRGVVGTGYLLSANNVVAAGLGFLFWVVAARRFPAADVGFAAAVAGAVTTVSGFGVLGLNSALLRYIPAYGDRWRALVVRGYGWVVLASAALAALLVVAAPRLSDQFAGLDDGGWAALAIAAAVTWSIFSLQDVALIARRRPLLVLVENAAVGIARLVALLLVSTGSDVAVTIIGVWLAPTVIAVVIVNGLLLLQGTDAGDARRAVGDGGLVRYCVFATFGSAAAALIVGFTPVIVTGVDGALANAAFFLPWTIATSLQVVATGMAAPLTVAAAAAADAAVATRRVLLHACGLLTLGGAAAVAVGPALLGVIGADYRPSTGLLVLLMVGAVLSGAVAVLLAIPRARGDVRSVVSIQWVMAAIVLVGTYVGLRLSGVLAIGVAFVASQVVGAILAGRLLRATRGATDVAADAVVPVPPALAQDETADPRPSPRLPASLLICSRGRPQLLLETVESILAGDRLPEEIIVIDQSAEANAPLAAIGRRDGCDVRYIHTAEVGLSRGRNRAIRESRQPLLVLTDDDMLVEPDWLSTMVEAATAAGPRALICGRVLPGVTDAVDGFAPSTIEDVEPARHVGRVGKDVVFTGNLAIHRAAFDEVGLFDERLGPGTEYPGAEDSDLGFRLLEVGYAILYEPRATVYHRAWRTWDGYVRLRWDYGKGMGGFLGKHIGLGRDRYMLRRFRDDLWRHASRVVRYAHCRSRRQTLGDAAYTVGLVIGALRFRLVTARRARP